MDQWNPNVFVTVGLSRRRGGPTVAGQIEAPTSLRTLMLSCRSAGGGQHLHVIGQLEVQPRDPLRVVGRQVDHDAVVHIEPLGG